MRQACDLHWPTYDQNVEHDALNLLAKVMAWNLMQMQGWANRRQHIAPETDGKYCAYSDLKGSACVSILVSGTARYASEIMPSLAQSIRARSA